MGMCAEVICIGPYSKRVSEYLEYDPKHYANTKEGAIISRVLFGILEGSTVSREFASLLGIDDAWDFNQHKIDKSGIDVEGLRKFGAIYTDYDEDVEALLILMENGFELHFCPNG